MAERVHEHDATDGARLVRSDGIDACWTHGCAKPPNASLKPPRIWLEREPDNFLLGDC